MITDTGYVLIRNGVEIARHPHRVTCAVEAIERRLATRSPAGVDLHAGVEIRATGIKEAPHGTRPSGAKGCDREVRR